MNESSEVEKNLFDKNSSVVSDTDKEKSYPKGTTFSIELDKDIIEHKEENTTVNNSEEKKYEQPKIYDSGKKKGQHKKTCLCIDCYDKNIGNTKTNNVVNDEVKPIEEKLQEKHGVDVITKMWQNSINASISFFGKINWRIMKFQEEELADLKAVQPEGFFSRKSYMLYFTMLITYTIEKWLTGKNPEIQKVKEDIADHIKEDEKLS